MSFGVGDFDVVEGGWCCCHCSVEGGEGCGGEEWFEWKTLK